MSHLGFLGAAYAAVWLLIFAYAWRLSRATRKLSERLDELERVGKQGSGT